MRSLKEGLKFHAHNIKAGFTPEIFTSNQLITLFSKHRLILEAQKLFDELPERNVFTWNAIICAHVKTQNLVQAQALFDSAPEKDSVTYNSILSGFVRTDGYETHAIKLFLNMQSASDRVKVDEFTLTTMLNLTAKLCIPCYGRQLQSFMVKTGNDADRFVTSALIDMYSKCGCFRDSCQAFNFCKGVGVDLVTKNVMVAACCREGELEMARDVFWNQPELNDEVSWNTLISGYAQNGGGEEAIELVGCMSKSGFRWNEHTCASVLSACSSLKNLNLCKEVHAWVLKDGMSSNPFISSGIVDVYSKCSNMKYAESVHAAIGLENSFSITSLIVGYSFQGTMVEAKRLFDSSSDKNFVMWTAMFSGYVKSQQCEAVFELLKEFNAKGGTIPDALFLISGLGACALQADMGPGKQIHGYALRSGIEIDEKLISAMVDMYSKCGNIMYARFLFERAIVRDSILYNVMIAAYAHHGYEKEAIQIFDEMLERGFRPDEVTFLALLSACRHSGLVEIGEKYFYSMVENYVITPGNDHYACMIDLYGRSNQLEKAVEFMRKIPIERDAVLLGTFLNACKISRNVELAREAEEELLRIGDDNRAGYVQLANVYAAEGQWVEMGRIRKKMRGKEVKKFAGCSWVCVKNRVHIFTSGYRFHSQTEAIYSILDCLNFELDDMVKGKLVLQHSVRGVIS